MDMDGETVREMKIRVELDPDCKSPEVIIRAEQRNELVENIISAIESSLKAGHALRIQNHCNRKG